MFKYRGIRPDVSRQNENTLTPHFLNEETQQSHVSGERYCEGITPETARIFKRVGSGTSSNVPRLLPRLNPKTKWEEK